MAGFINNISINGFRSIRSATLDPLSKINLIIGPNSSGKSSLLQSIFMFCLDGDADKISTLAPPETEETDLDSVTAATNWMFHANHENFIDNIVLEGNVDNIKRSVRLTHFDRNNAGIHEAQYAKSIRDTARISSQVKGAEIPPTDITELINSAKSIYELATVHDAKRYTGRLYLSALGPMVESHKPPRPHISAALTKGEAAYEILAKQYDNLADEDRRNKLLLLMRSIDPNVVSIRIGVAADSTPVIRVVHQDLGVVPINLLGDGFVAAFHYAILACRSGIGCMLFDEFDAHIHVETLKLMANFFQEQADTGMQFFFTTHRYDTVEAFVQLVEQGWHHLSVLQVSKMNGEAQVKVFSGDKLLKNWRDFGLDLRIPS